MAQSPSYNYEYKEGMMPINTDLLKLDGKACVEPAPKGEDPSTAMNAFAWVAREPGGNFDQWFLPIPPNTPIAEGTEILFYGLTTDCGDEAVIDAVGDVTHAEVSIGTLLRLAQQGALTPEAYYFAYVPDNAGIRRIVNISEVGPDQWRIGAVEFGNPEGHWKGDQIIIPTTI